jgi:hypothetical protein
MNATEFSDQFDVLYNNIASNQAPGLTEYEKSVFLTKAQYEILKNYFTPEGNKYKTGFDGNAKRQADFSSLIRVANLVSKTLNPQIDNRSKVFEFNNDIWLVINEVIRDSQGKQYQVIPITYDEYVRLMSKPYKYPCKNQAWRLMSGTSADTAKYVEIISNISVINSYVVRYLKKPYPIITVDLENTGVSIEGQVKPLDTTGNDSNSELPEELHQEILQRAVELAKVAYTGEDKTIVELGQRSE